MKLLKTIVYAAMAASLYACNKPDNHTPELKETGTITIHSPQGKTKYVKGDTVHIRAMITANQQLHGYEAYIVHASGDTLWQQDDHAHKNELKVQGEWVNTLATPAALKLVIKTDLDHHGNSIVNTEEFYTQ